MTTRKKLSEFADIVSGYAIPSKHMQSEGTPILKITNIKEDGSIDFENTVKYDLTITDKLNKFLLKDRDILVCMTGATIGKAASQIKVNGQYLVNQRVAILRAKDERLQKLVNYIVTNSTFREYAMRMGRGAAQPNISAAEIGNFEISIVDDVEQQIKIGDYLSLYDDLIENNRRQIRLLEEAAQRLYREWFIDLHFPNYQNTTIINNLPQGWRKVSANDCFNNTITIGKTPPRAEHNCFSQTSGIKWVSIADMGKSSMFIIDTNERLTNDAIEKYNVRVIPKFTILVSFKLTVGRVGITTEQMCTNEAIAHFICPNNNMLEYSALYLKNFNYDILGNTSSISQAVNSKIIKNMPFILPKEKVLTHFHKIAKPIFGNILSLQQQISQAQAARDLLLPRLMSGEINL